MRRVKIISDGTVHGTHVLNEDGRLIPGIVRIEFEPIDARDPKFHIATIKLYVDMELTGDVSIIDAYEGVFNRKGEKTHGIEERTD